MQKVILDCEVYKNYFLISFLSDQNKTFKEFEFYPEHPLDLKSVNSIMRKYTTVSFNGNNYDLLMISAALSGYNNQQLKNLSDKIITSGKPSWLIAKSEDILIPSSWDHVDLIEVASGKASLKIYGGRLHSAKLQDLPIEPDATIRPYQREELRLYCRNDLITTLDLFNFLKPQVELREQMSSKYGIDLRSKSDAQIAESLIKQYLKGKTPKRQTEVKPFKYRVPDWVSFESEEFREVLSAVKSCVFKVSDKGSVVLPDVLNKAIDYNGAKYKFGIGGLHSQESRQVIKPSENQLLGEFDVASLYPSIIIEQGCYPLHLGEKFLKVYSDIKETRLKAKRSGDKIVDKVYKIVLNGSYGKFGSKYSFLYSPELLIQTTITGQLALLMLIEKMTLAGGKVVSANTDGVNVLYDKKDYNKIHSVAFDWELLNGYELEYTPYTATYNRDVNNYIALTDYGCKGKGAFADANIMKNPQNEICIIAVKEYLKNNTPVEQTITQCDDVRRFVTVRAVTGGAIWRDDYLGKAVRFYYSKDGDSIHYKKNGNKVPKSDGSKPLMNLPESLPDDIDLQWYINESISMIADLGVVYA